VAFHEAAVFSQIRLESKRRKLRAVTTVACSLASLALACNLILGNQELSQSDGGADAAVDHLQIDRIVPSDGARDSEASAKDAPGDLSDTDEDAGCTMGAGIEGKSDFCKLNGKVSDASLSKNYICADFDNEAALSEWSSTTRGDDAGTITLSPMAFVSPSAALFAQTPSSTEAPHWFDNVQWNFGGASFAALSFDLNIASESTNSEDIATVVALGFRPDGGGNPHVTIGLNAGKLSVGVSNIDNAPVASANLAIPAINEWIHLSLAVQLTGPDAGANLALVQCGSSLASAFVSIFDAGFPASSDKNYMAIGLPFVATPTGTSFAVYIDNVVFNAE
jgi:hypothetical protein